MLLADDDPRHFGLQRRNPGRILQYGLACGPQGWVGLDQHGPGLLDDRRFLNHYP
jgi:hypothetical protein